MHALGPHTPGLGSGPPPHACPAGHVPHISEWPQPSPIVPHTTPAAVHVVGVHDPLPH